MMRPSSSYNASSTRQTPADSDSSRRAAASGTTSPHWYTAESERAPVSARAMPLRPPKYDSADVVSMPTHYSMLQSDFKDAVSLFAYGATGMETMGQRIKQLRLAKGWNQEALADRLGVSISAVSQWERDETKNPKIEFFLTLAEVLGTDPHYLAFGPERVAPGKSRRAAP
jgi:DNA-binding XRE family transcriptional regulator